MIICHGPLPSFAEKARKTWGEVPTQASGNLALKPTPCASLAKVHLSNLQLSFLTDKMTNLGWVVYIPFSSTPIILLTVERRGICATKPFRQGRVFLLHHDPFPQVLRLWEPHPAEKLAK